PLCSPLSLHDALPIYTNIVTYPVVEIPPNDYFTNAIKIPAAGALLFSDNRFATLEPGEPVHAGVPSVAASLWWNWTPTASGNALDRKSTRLNSSHQII